ncbi:MAG: ZIP family metal transporter [Gemmatimonadaceae bacterium]|nr:ZIP family metal transporter [Gemmatimonadaceae bacterium]
MSASTAAYLAVAAVTGLPLLVLVALATSPRPLGRVLPWLVSFGAGALIGAAVFHLLPEAYERHPDVRFVAIAVVAGAVGSFILERLLHRLQHTSHETPAPAPSLSAFDDPAMVAVSAIADGAHNFVDGALIAAAFLAGEGSGLTVALAMLAHELPREIGTFGVFVHYGTRPSRALLLSLLTGALAFLGAGFTFWLGAATATVAELLVPFAAGSFLFVGAAVSISQLKAQRTWDLPLPQLAASAAGFALSALAAAFGGH